MPNSFPLLLDISLLSANFNSQTLDGKILISFLFAVARVLDIWFTAPVNGEDWREMVAALQWRVLSVQLWRKLLEKL